MTIRSRHSTDGHLAEFADVVLDLSHILDIRSPELRGVVPLTGTEITVIRMIHRHPRSTPSQIAEQTGLQRSNVSTALRTLEAGGLVVREQSTGNARQIELVPTALATASIERIHEFWSNRLRRLPDELLAEAVAAVETLTRIAEALDDRGSGDSAQT